MMNQFLQNFTNIKHEVIVFKEKEILDNIDAITQKLGEPFSDASLVPTYYLCKHVNEKVVLSGDGADEIFMGYPRYLPLYLKKRTIPIKHNKNTKIEILKIVL